MTTGQLIDQCVDAGIIFHPRGMMLRPETTLGDPGVKLLSDVKHSKKEILSWFAEIWNWADEFSKEEPPF